MVIGTLVYTAALHVVPKGLSYLCTRIENPISRLDRLRDLMGRVQEAVRNAIGPKAWFIATDVVADNAWISFFFISYLTKWNWQRALLANPLDVAFAFFAFSGGSMLIRYAIGQVYPPLRPYIATRLGEVYGV